MRTMQFIPQLLFFAALWVLCASQGDPDVVSNATMDTLAMNTTEIQTPEPTQFQCHICGEKGKIGNLVGMVQTPFGMLTCSALQGVATAGAFPAETCPDIQAQAEQKCACTVDSPAPTKAPTPIGTTTTPPAQSPTTRPVPSQPTVTEPYICRICGEGRTVGNNGRLVQTPMGTSSCAVLAAAGSAGNIPEPECSTIQDLASESCQCIEGNPPTMPPFQTRAPAASSQQFHCPICGEGMMATDPSGMVTVPSRTQRTCMQLLDAAAAGNIPVAQCVQLQQYTAPCGCEPMSPTMAPIPTGSPSMVPSDFPSLFPTQFPLEPGQTRSPTSAPAVAFDSCFDDLSDIHALERDLEDASIRRKYVLCPNTTFALGFVNDEGEIVDGQKMIHLRPNVIYQCGEDGSRSNDCILHGGDFGLASFYEVFEGISEAVDNVIIRGLTFQSQQLFSIVLESAGDVTFVDCAFQNHGNMAPIALQWRGNGPDGSESSRTRKLRETQEEKFPTVAKNFYRKQSQWAKKGHGLEHTDEVRELQATNLRHIVTFKDCVFKENTAVKGLAFPGVIENTFLSELVVINSLFEKNNFGATNNPTPFGYAIRSFGPLTIRSTCFIGNTFHNFAPVQAFGEVEASDNYGTTDQTDLNCQFIAVFDSEEDFNNGSPRCMDYDLDTCGFTQPPTPAPTTALEIPDVSPTNAPLAHPTAKPLGTPPPATIADPVSGSPTQFSCSVLFVSILGLVAVLL